LTNVWKLLLFLVILLYNKHQVSNQIKENLVFWKNRMFWFAKPDSSVSETGGSRISRTSDKSSKMTTTNPDDWRTPLVHYLENPGHIADRKVQRQALKYVMLDNTLYRRTIDGL
jgi:hypothetical protein